MISQEQGLFTDTDSYFHRDAQEDWIHCGQLIQS